MQRLNADERGRLLGAFKGEDRILIVTQSGVVKTQIPDLSMHFPPDMLVLEKWESQKPLSVVYFDGTKDRYFGKRFLIEAPDKEEHFLKEGNKIRLEWFSTDWRPVCTLHFVKPRGAEAKAPQEVSFEDFIAPKGIKAMGNQLTNEKLKSIEENEPLPYIPEPEVETTEIETEAEEVSAIDSSISSSETNLARSENDEKVPLQSNNDGEGQISLDL